VDSGGKSTAKSSEIGGHFWGKNRTGFVIETTKHCAALAMRGDRG
jgi:hypothetical protein